MAEPFDSTLVAAKAGADWAWVRIYDEHAPRVLQYLRTQQVRDPEDLLGDVFVRVVRGVHQFEGDEDAFRGWVFRIAQRRVIDGSAAAVDWPMTIQGGAQASESPDVADVAQRRDAEQRALRTLAVLPPDQRAAVFMRVALDLPIAEIAAILGKREAATKMLLQRGFRTLRERREAAS